MFDGPYIAEVAALIGDPARANMLLALKDEGALTASELSHIAGVSPQTASGHLAKLAQAGLATVERQGRHRYYRLANAGVADALEALMGLSVKAAPRHRPPGPCDEAVRFARSCYDHLAGRLGVALTWSMVEQGSLRSLDDGFVLTGQGERTLSEFGLELDVLRRGRRPLTRRCLDWSERRPHLGGALGAAVMTRAETLGWIERRKASRAVVLTQAGCKEFKEVFRIDLDPA
jgi:DNA-binding transcriptional ArsR family regulator